MYGITFGRKNSSNEYTFLLSGNGSYMYRKFDNDVYKKIIPFTESSAIKTGLNQSNIYKLAYGTNFENGFSLFELSSLGALTLNAYDSTNNTGTPTYLLGTDA